MGAAGWAGIEIGGRYLNNALNGTTGDIRQIADVMVGHAEAGLHFWLNLTLIAGVGLAGLGVLVAILGGVLGSKQWAGVGLYARHATLHVLINPWTSRRFLIPPRRLPFIGDVVGIRLGKPVQSGLADVARPRADLGPQGVGDPDRHGQRGRPGGELSDESRFRKFVGLHLPPLRRIVGDALFTAENDEPNWQLAHDILAPAFTREAMSGYHAIMLQVARELLARWDAAADAGQSRRRHPPT